MHPMLKGWLACPTCGGDLVDAADGGVRCTGECGTEYGVAGRWLDLVDTKQKVSSEGPGDTLAMAWRRRRWDELRGPEAPENADYLAAIWERLRPDDRVLDLGCGPASFLAWLADFAPDLAILGLDLSAPALEEAEHAIAGRDNVVLARASTRRRLPVGDGSCDVVLRRLAPGLPEEVVRALAPGGYYLRFTFGPGHWREVYDLMPGLPRAREDAIAGEAERLRALGMEVEEPIRKTGTEEFTTAAVMLALRSNPAAFHADKVDFKPMRGLWSPEGERLGRVALSTEYAILVARKPEGPAEKPKRTRKTKAAEESAAEPTAEASAPIEETAAAEAAPQQVAEALAGEKPKRTRKKASPAGAPEEAAPDAPAAEKPKRTRRKAAEPASQSVDPAPGSDLPAEPAADVAPEPPATEPAGESPPARKPRTRRGTSAPPPDADRSPVDAEPSG